MSTLKVTNIQATGEGVAGAWLVGTNAAGLTDSFNFSSGTDDGTGQYNYSFTTNMANTTWSASGLVEVVSRIFSLDNTNHSKTADKVYVRIVTDAGVNEDRSHSLKIHGDLA
jgi:hypothetical protein